MAKRKNSISIDFNGFAEYAEKLEEFGANVKEVFTEIMEEAAEQVQSDTEAALAKGNLPAQGKYSHNKTRAALISSPKVTWSGYTGELPLGFDKTVPGAGGFLITGTPKMAPDYELEKIYSGRKYERDLKKKIDQSFGDAIRKYMG